MDPYIECKHSAEYNQEKDEEAHTTGTYSCVVNEHFEFDDTHWRL